MTFTTPNNRFSGIFSWINPYSRQFFLIKCCHRVLSGIFSVIITSESVLLGVYQEFLNQTSTGCMEDSLRPPSEYRVRFSLRCCRSGKEVTLPSPPPLETARARFPACSLSLANAPARNAVRPHRCGHTCTILTRGRLPVARGGRTSKRCRCRHLLCLLKQLTERSRAARPEGSLPACAWGDVTQPLSAPLQGGLRFLPPPLPAAASASLARAPTQEGRNGLTTFRRCTGVG